MTETTPIQRLIRQATAHLALAGLPCAGTDVRRELGGLWAATRHSQYVHGHHEPRPETLREALAIWQERHPEWAISPDGAPTLPEGWDIAEELLAARQRIAELERVVADAVFIARGVEWAASTPMYSDCCCPMCRAEPRDDRTHEDGCILGAFLATEAMPDPNAELDRLAIAHGRALLAHVRADRAAMHDGHTYTMARAARLAALDALETEARRLAGADHEQT